MEEPTIQLKSLSSLISNFLFLNNYYQEITQLIQKLENKDVRFLFAGESMVGKSAMLKSLMGDSPLRGAFQQPSKWVCELQFSSSQAHFEIYLKNHDTIDGGNDSDIQTSISKVSAEIQIIKLFLSETIFPSNVVLIDSPGMNLEENLEKIKSASENVDFLCFCVDVNQGFTNRTAQLLDPISKINIPVLLILTKCDTKPVGLAKLEQFIQQNYHKYISVIISASNKTSDQEHLITTLQRKAAEIRQYRAQRGTDAFLSYSQKILNLVDLRSKTLEIDGNTNDRIRAIENEFIIIRNQIQHVLDEVSMVIDDAKEATVRVFVKTISNKKDALIQMALTNPDELKLNFISEAQSVVEAVLITDYIPVIRTCIMEATKKINQLSKYSNDIDLDAILEKSFDLSHNLQLEGAKTLRSFIDAVDHEQTMERERHMLRTQPLEYNADSDTEDKSLEMLLAMFKAGSKLLARNKIINQVTKSLENVKLNFKREMQSYSTKAKTAFEENVNYHISSSKEDTLISIQSINLERNNSIEQYKIEIQELKNLKKSLDLTIHEAQFLHNR